MTNADPTLPIMPHELHGKFCSEIVSAVMKGIGDTIGNYLNYNIPVHLIQVGIGVALQETFAMLPNDDMKLSHLAQFKHVLDKRIAETMKPAPDRSKLS
jgi:hypothetical protein